MEYIFAIYVIVFTILLIVSFSVNIIVIRDIRELRKYLKIRRKEVKEKWTRKLYPPFK